MGLECRGPSRTRSPVACDEGCARRREGRHARGGCDCGGRQISGSPSSLPRGRLAAFDRARHRGIHGRPLHAFDRSACVRRLRVFHRRVPRRGGRRRRMPVPFASGARCRRGRSLRAFVRVARTFRGRGGFRGIYGRASDLHHRRASGASSRSQRACVHIRRTVIPRCGACTAELVSFHAEPDLRLHAGFSRGLRAGPHGRRNPAHPGGFEHRSGALGGRVSLRSFLLRAPSQP